MGGFHRSEFLSEIEGHFPAVRTRVDKHHSTPKVGMLQFENFVNISIAFGDEDTVRKAFQLMDRALGEGDAELKSAVTSLSERVNFEDGVITRSWAAKLMPPRVLECYAAAKGRLSSQGPA